MSFPFQLLIKNKLGIALLTATLGLPTALAADLLGANAIVDNIRKATGAPEEKKPDPGKSAAKNLLQDLENFKLDRAKLSVDEAVERWLKFYERFRTLPTNVTSSNPYGLPNPNGLSLKSLITALPSPPAWPLLKTRILARQSASNDSQDATLGILAHFLTQDQESLEKALSKMKVDADMGGNSTSSSALQRLTSHWQRQKLQMGGGTAITDTFDAYLQSLKGERIKGEMQVQIPDLITLSNEKRAEELILKALTIPGISLSVPAGGATLELAKRIVLNNTDKLTNPQWRLITNIQDISLYEAIGKKFPNLQKNDKKPTDLFQANDEYSPGTDDSIQNNAKIFYIMGLIATNRLQDAKEQAKQLEPENFKSRQFKKTWLSFDKFRFAPGLNQFCKEVLADRHELPLWKQCGLIATDAKSASELIASIDTAAKKSDISLESRLGILERKADLLLALDREEEAISLLRDALKTNVEQNNPQAQKTLAQAKLKLALRLAILGNLLARPELLRESEGVFSVVLKNTEESFDYLSSFQNDSSVDKFLSILLENGNFPAAENIVLTKLLAMLNSPKLAEMGNTNDMVLISGFLGGYLARLVEIYDRAGRHDDVLALLEKAPWWGVTDFIDLTDQYEKLAPAAAKALHAKGRTDEAVKILKNHLQAHPGDDRAYRLLTDILGSQAIPWLDALQALDRFEERPLIWKAALLTKAGTLDQAEATIRQALKIDPTDGEQKAGDRARAYAVLADILKAKGKMDDAAFFERVVASVHIAEKGDQFTEAGLLRKSLALYEEASTNFADAYCVQWRLAERFSAMGKIEEAKKHYEIAFERMPEQFGQVAQFCFGCEGVFTNQQSTSVAEEVLTRLAKTTPQKPQVHYLLGQLRESQGRKLEAYQHFHTAVELDPAYLDGLKALYSLRKDVFLSQAEVDGIALRLLKLDPLNRHGQVDPGEIADLKQLWDIYVGLGQNKIIPPKELMALTASQQALEALLQKFGGNNALLETRRAYLRQQRVIPEPGDAVANNDFVRILLLENND